MHASRFHPPAAQSGSAGYEVGSADVVMSPISTVEIAEQETAKQLLRLLEILEDHDDVQSVSANFDMDEEVMAQFSAA